jgi:hypothetical protein
MRRALARLTCASFALLAIASAAPACSQGEGEGSIAGKLDVPNCWAGDFALNADFFAAVPYRQGMLLRIQNGSDFQNFSDGMTILLNDINQIRPDPARQSPGRYGQPLRVDLPNEVTPPGVPVTPDPDPALVNVTLYLQRSCRTQAVTLQAVDVVDVSEGTCTVAPMMGADPSQGCAPDKEAAEAADTGRSIIAFTSVANGRLDEETAAERLNAGCFDIYLADPREPALAPGAPPRCRGHIRGSFSFFFERGRPSQPFP